MKVKLKSNGKILDIKKADFEKFSKDQQRSYIIIEKDDVVETKVQTADNKAEKKDKTGDGK